MIGYYYMVLAAAGLGEPLDRPLVWYETHGPGPACPACTSMNVDDFGECQTCGMDREWYIADPLCQLCDGSGGRQSSCPRCNGYGRIMPGRKGVQFKYRHTTEVEIHR